MDPTNNEIDRIEQSYQERDRAYRSQSWREAIYHPRHPLGRLLYEHSYNILVDAINALDLDLEQLKVLDFGCGEGAWLRLLVELGATPANLTGIDLSPSRLATARANNPAICWRQTKGERIEAPTACFDLVLQVVVFSSIVDRSLARELLAELLRVTRPGGYLLWIDHKQSHSGTLAGYSVAELLEALPGCQLVYQRSVHPRYFRSRYGQPWLCRTLFRFFEARCDSWLLVFQKGS